MSKNHGTIAVDLDGTLARYDGWQGHEHIGEPVPAMMARVQTWIAQGRNVVIFTARAAELHKLPPVYQWLRRHGLGELKVTNVKTPDIVEIWDDRAVQVIRNAGRTYEEEIVGRDRIIVRLAPHGPGCRWENGGSKCTCWKADYREIMGASNGEAA